MTALDFDASVTQNQTEPKRSRIRTYLKEKKCADKLEFGFGGGCKHARAF
jgi:hypothetical protein